MNTKTNVNQKFLFILITFLSGFCGIFFETLSNKVFTYLFGISLISTTVTIIVFFLGLALGSYYFTKIARNTKTPLIIYTFLELIATSLLLLYPSLYKVGLSGLNFSLEYGETYYFLLKTLLVFFLLMLPTFFLGGTVPFLYTIVSRFYKNDHFIPLFYGLNTLGAATGVILSSYFFFPKFGLEGTSYLGAGINICIFTLLLLYWRKSHEFELGLKLKNLFKISFTINKITWSKTNKTYFAIAVLSGLFVFGLEIIWFNLLALIIGNSVYSFAIMLATILIGVTIGSLIISQKKIQNKERLFIRTQLFLTLYLFVSLFLWDKLNSIFTMVGLFDPNFMIMELTRFSVAFLLLILPCVVIGMSFPLLLEIYKKIRKNTASTIGELFAFNSIGSALGVLIGCFILVNFFGNKVGITIIGTIPLFIAYLFLKQEKVLNKKWILTLLTIAVVRFPLTPNWDVREMAGGQNIYFTRGNNEDDKILFHKESTYSGVITLIDKKGMKTLYTNGKFEGNNTAEILDQYLMSTIPALFSKEYKRAANLGLGTGGTLGAITQFPYKEVDLIEISPDIIEVASKHFREVNFNALSNKKVNVFLDDGRIHFMKKKTYYDLITMESSSIWFAGSANLYSHEFYKIVHNSLKHGGVFQQWIQLHHISMKDILRIIKTFKQSFKQPSLWLMGHQAILLGKKGEKFQADYQKLVDLSKNPKVKALLKKIGYDSIFKIFNHVLLSSANIDTIIQNQEQKWKEELIIHTDMNPILEFSTPQSNDLANAFAQNRNTLLDHKWTGPEDFIKDIPSQKIYDKIVKDFYSDIYEEFFTTMNF